MLFYEPTDCWIKGINKKIMQNMWNMCFYILYVNESLFNITCRKCNKFFGHLLCYRSTLAGLRRCLEGNPGTSWLFSLIDLCEFDMCLINWRIFSSANCFNVQMWRMWQLFQIVEHICCAPDKPFCEKCRNNFSNHWDRKKHHAL